LLAAMSLLSVPEASAEPVNPPPVPDNIRIPAGNKAFVVGHALGTQNYSCLPAGIDSAGNPRYAWTLFTPQATLFAHNHKEITTHYLSPNPYEPSPSPFTEGPIRATWQDSKDSSLVWGKVVPGDASSLLVDMSPVVDRIKPWRISERVGWLDDVAWLVAGLAAIGAVVAERERRRAVLRLGIGVAAGPAGGGSTAGRGATWAQPPTMRARATRKPKRGVSMREMATGRRSIGNVDSQSTRP